MIVLDTSALLFWTLDLVRLSAAAERSIQQADKILVSSISIWEIGIKVKRGKLEIPITMEEYVKGLNQLEKVEIQAVNVRDWLGNLALEWEHRDPADRTIVALAARHGCQLITSDHVIIGFYPNSVW